MKMTTLSMPDLILLIGTRVALGAGIGLLVATKLERPARLGAGWALFAVGALSSIPIAMNVFRSGSTDALGDLEAEGLIEPMTEPMVAATAP
jgi:hypothetical protein